MPRGILFGSQELLTVLADSFPEAPDLSFVTESPSVYQFPDGNGKHFDFLIASLEYGGQELQNLSIKAREHNPNIRLVLVDPYSEYDGSAKNIGAHSLVPMNPEAARTMLQFWMKTLYPR